MKAGPPTAAPWVPASGDLDALREAAAGCRGCDLWKLGTQTVFGEGPTAVPVMFVGEQPGDKEDIEGRPFVGPAGQLFDRALEDAGIPRSDVYVTNAVKHFKWQARGKRRIHQKPSVQEVRACYPWLDAELSVVQPRFVVALGATAAQSMLGSKFRVTAHRREWVEWDRDPSITATVHPSSILRTEGEDRRAAYDGFVGDLAFVADALTGIRR